MAATDTVIPAKAGISAKARTYANAALFRPETPAFAGVTVN